MQRLRGGYSLCVIRHIDLPGGTFAANLRAAREAHDWSIAELARRTGLDQSTVYRWEQEQRQPTLPAILRLASTFSMTGSELIKGIEARPPTARAD